MWTVPALPKKVFEVLTLTRGLAQLAELQRDDEQGLIPVLVNSSSAAEANLALSMLRDKMPERTLVTAVNIREVLASLPSAPTAMPIEISMLARVHNLRKNRSAWERVFWDSGGLFKLLVLGDGNFCYDVIIWTSDTGNVFLKSIPQGDDILHPEALELLWKHETLLDELVSLTQSMGFVFTPTLYLSLEDWLLEHAESAIDDIHKLF